MSGYTNKSGKVNAKKVEARMGQIIEEVVGCGWSAADLEAAIAHLVNRSTAIAVEAVEGTDWEPAEYVGGGEKLEILSIVDGPQGDLMCLAAEMYDLRQLAW